jgi:hypothetical protein
MRGKEYKEKMRGGKRESSRKYFQLPFYILNVN